MLKKDITKFRKTVYDFYNSQGRHSLPWRKTKNPYYITVSELMLQQTQVQRVIPKYKAFIEAFPTVSSLAQAPLSAVLALWSGLGYNRRAKFLYQLAQKVQNDHNGKFPKTIEKLRSLPGIGPYTAQAIAAFAYNTPGICIETNIRTVYIHHFFKDGERVPDAALLPLIAETLDQQQPRVWYAALMDYGSYLKTSGNTVHRLSTSYVRQSPFKGSRREVRGAITKLLLKKPQTTQAIIAHTGKEEGFVLDVLGDLEKEGFIMKKGRLYRLA